MDIRCVLIDYMRELKLSPKHLGYNYIEDSVMLLYADFEGRLGALNKYVYPTVASKYKTSYQNIFKSIERAIIYAFEKGGLEIFGTKTCPTNKQVICYLANKITVYSCQHQARILKLV